jgi:hypothetical protein
MRSAVVLSISLILSGCATKPTTNADAAVQRNVCTDGLVVLRFVDDTAALAPRIAKGLEWPTRAIWECPNATLKVVGLPSPSETSLQGKRANSVVQVLRGFGAPEPSFELGNDADQARPFLEILARP